MEQNEIKPFYNFFVVILTTVKAMFVFLMMAFMTALVHCLRLCHRCFGVKVSKIDPVFYEDWFSVNFGLQAFKTIFRDNRKNFECKLKESSDAVNISLFTMEQKQTCLFDFQNPGRPLIVNFGSCS